MISNFSIYCLRSPARSSGRGGGGRVGDNMTDGFLKELSSQSPLMLSTFSASFYFFISGRWSDEWVGSIVSSASVAQLRRGEAGALLFKFFFPSDSYCCFPEKKPFCFQRGVLQLVTSSALMFFIKKSCNHSQATQKDFILNWLNWAQQKGPRTGWTHHVHRDTSCDPPSLCSYTSCVFFFSQLDILCNEEILGKDHTLKFVVVTRWRFKVTRRRFTTTNDF